LARRRVEVVFVAEMSRHHRGMVSGAEDTRRLRDETRDAQREVARLGSESQRAAEQVSRSARRAAVGMQSARGDFARAGAQSGRAFGDGFVRDAQGRLRGADSRFSAEGERLGDAVNRGMRRAASRGGIGGIGNREMLLLAAGAAAATGALQGIPPVLAAIGGSLAAIPSLAAGATASIASLGLGLHGVGAAIKEVFNPKAGGGGGGGGGGGFDDTAARLRRVEAAERNLARAQRDARLAQQEVSAARRRATRDLRDMAIALGRVALDERAAQLALEEAERDLAEVQAKAHFGSPGVVDPLEMRRAQLAVDQAKQSLIETRVAAQDLREDQAAAAKAGVEGSELVQAALRRQQDAEESVLDATNALKDAQEALARSAAGGGGGGGGVSVATAYSKLSPAAKRFVDQIRDLKDELTGIQRLAQEHVFAGLDRELEQTARVALPFARRQVIRFGDTWNETFTQLFRLGRNRQFLAGLDAAFASSDRFFDKVNARIPVMGRTLANLFTGAVPFVDKFGDSLLSYIDDFDAFIDRAARDGRLDVFFRDAAEQADALLDIGKELIRLIANLGAMRQGSTLLRDMADALKRFNDTAHDTRNVEAIIDAGNEAIRGVIDVLRVLGDTLGDTLADPSTREAIRAFFDVLGVGAQVVDILVRAFNDLPGPVKEVLLVGGALYLLYGRIQRVAGPLATMLGRINNVIGRQGPLGAQAAVGMERFAAGARRAGLALVAVQTASAVLGSQVNPQVDALAKHLDEFGRTGRASGEATRLFGDDLGKLDTALKDVADSGAWSSFARGTAGTIEALTGLGNVFDDSLTKSKERLEALDQALTHMVRSGNAEGAAAAFNRIAASAAEQGVSVRELERVLPGYTAAVEVAGDSSSTAAGEVGEVGDEADAAKRKVDELKAAFDRLFGAQMDIDRATIAYKQGLKDLRAELVNGKRTLDDNTQAGRDNVSAVLDQIQRIRDLRQANIDNGMSVTEANRIYDGHLNQLRKTLLQLGYNESEVDALIRKYREIPRQVATAVNLNISAAERAYKTVKSQIKDLNGRVVTVTVRYNQQGIAVAGGEKARGGTKVAFRWGGVVEHAQTGLLREATIFPPAAGPARYAFAEPGTGGEAFIPRFGDPARSVSIGRRAMEWYGYTVVPKSMLAAKWGQAATTRTLPMQPMAPVVNVTVTPVAPNGDRLMAEIVRGVRYTVRTDGGGDVQKALGS